MYKLRHCHIPRASSMYAKAPALFMVTFILSSSPATRLSSVGIWKGRVEVDGPLFSLPLLTSDSERSGANSQNLSHVFLVVSVGTPSPSFWLQKITEQTRGKCAVLNHLVVVGWILKMKQSSPLHERGIPHPTPSHINMWIWYWVRIRNWAALQFWTVWSGLDTTKHFNLWFPPSPFPHARFEQLSTSLTDKLDRVAKRLMEIKDLEEELEKLQDIYE